MPFIGKQPEVGAYQLIDSITTSATATYALTVNGSAYFPASARNLIVSLNGVTQAPESAYTVSGSNIVFDSALTASDVIDYILVIGDAVDIGTPSDGTVGTSQLASSIDLSGKTLTFANDQISGDAISGGTATLDGLTVDTSTLYVDSTNNRVGIGTASPADALSVIGTINVGISTNSGIGLTSTLTSGYQATIDASDVGLELQSGSSLRDITFGDGTTERMRVDCGTGNVGIGTNSPNALRSTNLEVSHPTGSAGITVDASTTNQYSTLRLTNNDTSGYDINYNFPTNGGLGIYSISAGVTRFILDSSGRSMWSNHGSIGVLNGNTTHSFQNNNTSENTMWLHNANASDGSAKLVLTSQRTASSAFNFIDCGANYPTSFTRQFLVRGDGVVYAQNTSIQSLSDERTKENIRDSEDGLDVINALRPVRFDFKEGFGNNRTNQLGFIAQEVEPVFADAVSEATETDERGLPYKSLGPSSLIPVLVKAIQEQQAMIETLQAQVAELQGAN